MISENADPFPTCHFDSALVHFNEAYVLTPIFTLKNPSPPLLWSFLKVAYAPCAFRLPVMSPVIVRLAGAVKLSLPSVPISLKYVLPSLVNVQRSSVSFQRIRVSVPVPLFTTKSALEEGLPEFVLRNVISSPLTGRSPLIALEPENVMPDVIVRLDTDRP